MSARLNPWSEGRVQPIWQMGLQVDRTRPNKDRVAGYREGLRQRVDEFLANIRAA